MGLTCMDNFSPLIEFCFSNSSASCFEVQQHFLTTLIVKNEMELNVMGWGHTQVKSTASTWRTDVTAEKDHSAVRAPQT